MSQELQASLEPTVIVKSDGQPYESEARAKAAISAKGLDSSRCEVVPQDDGFAILVSNSGPAGLKEKVWWVVFGAKSSPNDPDDVMLGVNGDVLTIQREQKVPIPERFLEVADHAVYPTFKQMPNEDRKVTSWVRKTPYTRFEEATWADFHRIHREGTRKAKKAAEEQKAA